MKKISVWFRSSFLKEDKYRIPRTIAEAIVSYAINHIAMWVSATKFSADLQALIVSICMIILTAVFQLLKTSDEESEI